MIQIEKFAQRRPLDTANFSIITLERDRFAWEPFRLPGVRAQRGSAAKRKSHSRVYDIEQNSPFGQGAYRSAKVQSETNLL